MITPEIIRRWEASQRSEQKHPPEEPIIPARNRVRREDIHSDDEPDSKRAERDEDERREAMRRHGVPPHGGGMKKKFPPLPKKV